MAKTKKELETELLDLEKKIHVLIDDFFTIKKNIQSIKKTVRTKQDNKKIADLKIQIANL